MMGLVLSPMNTAFSIGLMYEMIAAVVAVPFLALYAMRRV
jgi:hypothetical protein